MKYRYFGRSQRNVDDETTFFRHNLAVRDAYNRKEFKDTQKQTGLEPHLDKRTSDTDLAVQHGIITKSGA
jgi:hypothetical protein